jgi:hypothetical protein
VIYPDVDAQNIPERGDIGKEKWENASGSQDHRGLPGLLLTCYEQQDERDKLWLRPRANNATHLID